MCFVPFSTSSADGARTQGRRLGNKIRGVAGPRAKERGFQGVGCHMRNTRIAEVNRRSASWGNLIS